MAQQTVQILRTTTNTPPATLLPGSFSVELGADTRLWMGSAGGNRLLLSSNPGDVDLGADCTISATAPNVGSQTGVLWFDTVSGGLFVRLNDGSSVQWIQPTAAAGALGVQVGPGLTLNAGTSPPTIDFANPFPQAMTINGALRVQTAGAVIGPAATATPGAGALTLNANTVAPASIAAGTNLYMVGADNSNTRIEFDAYGTGVPSLQSRRARGTAATPTAVQNGDTLLFLQGQGYAASTWGTAAPNITIAASENWTAAANGSAMYFATTPAGGTSGVNSLILNGNSATFSGNVMVQTATVSVDNVVGEFKAPATSDAFVRLTAARIWGVGSKSSGIFTVADYSAPAARLQIDAAGNCTASSAWAVGSDAALKADIIDHPHGLAEILQLQPRRFRMVDDDRIATGLIAQELEAVMPELVGEMATPDGGTVKTVTETGVIWPLVNAIKELTARLEALEGAK